MENLDQNQLTEEQGVPRNSIVWKFAIIFGLIFIIYIILSIMFREQMMEQSTLVTILTGLIMLAGIIITQMQVRDKSFMGTMNFSKGLGTGMLFTIYLTLIIVVFGLLFNTVIFPETLQEQQQLAIDQMREQEMSQEQIDQAMKFTGFMFKPVGAALVGLFSNLFFGLILSLIGAAVTSRNK